MTTTIPARLRATREAMGLTQRDVSEITGIAPSNLSNLESGDVDFQISTLTRILDAMGMDLAFVPRNAPMSLQEVLDQSSRGRERLESVGVTPSDPEERLDMKRARGVDVSVEQSILTSGG